MTWAHVISSCVLRIFKSLFVQKKFKENKKILKITTTAAAEHKQYRQRTELDTNTWIWKKEAKKWKEKIVSASTFATTILQTLEFRTYPYYSNYTSEGKRLQLHTHTHVKRDNDKLALQRLWLTRNIVRYCTFVLVQLVLAFLPERYYCWSYHHITMFSKVIQYQ